MKSSVLKTNLLIACPTFIVSVCVGNAIATTNPQPSTAIASNSITGIKVEEPAPVSDDIFDGGADSLVARTVGSAEGTRTVEGDRTPAYKGHPDPGNGVWNLGSFSYQHGASSPEEADHKQLARLKVQTSQLLKKAEAQGVELTEEEKLNGIDLANQAPKAALNEGGYIERLAEAKKAGKTGWEAIAWARTYAYVDPATQKLDAPGLGNTIEGVRRDQERRMEAIAQALKAYLSEVKK